MSDETASPDPAITGTLPAGDDTAPQPEGALSPWPPSSPAAPSGPAGPPGRGGGRVRPMLLGALVGGLVGALAAGGLFLATDDNGTTTVVRTVAPAGPKVVTRPSSSIDSSGGVAAIIAKAEPAIVAITTGEGPGTGNGAAGTGFVLTSDGYIATNNHVIEGATKIEVAFANGNTLSATVKAHDASTDLALLKVNGSNLPTVEIGDSGAVQVGDEVVAIGNALALQGGLSVTRGIISAKNRDVPEENGNTLVGALQTDAAINPGNSGGPLLDAQGRVIGINTAIAPPAEAQNVGFAIPISPAKAILDDLQAGRKPAFLGVATQDVTPAVAKQLGLHVTSGAYVTRVTSGAPAEAAGIRQGDVIVEIGGQKIGSAADVQTAVRSHHPGDTVTVVVDRKGDRRTFQAKLVERPDAG